MKQVSLCLLLLAFLIPLNVIGQESKSYKPFKKASNEFTIKGKIDGRDTGRIILVYTNSLGKNVRDTSLLKNGVFELRGEINQPTDAAIIGHTTSNLMDDTNRTLIFLEPTKLRILLMENDFKNVKMTGSLTQNEFSKLQKDYSKPQKKLTLVRDSLSTIVNELKIYKDSTILINKKDALITKSKALYENIISIERKFISTHSSSHLSPYLLKWYVGSNGISVDSATRIFENLTPKVRQSDLGFAIKQLIYSKKLANVGDVAANFEAIDMNGKIISLKEFRGKKFVLLDFWYAYCPPCRAQSPALKKLYSELKDKDFEIIGMAKETEKLWRSTIAEDGTGEWRHLMLSSITKTDNNFPIDLSYNLIGYPTLVLINKEGVIIHRSAGYGGEESFNIYRELLTK
jgi:thiol-disulfide isomerase/thioredoxin